MGFSAGFASKMKRLFFSRRVKAKSPDESMIPSPAPKLGVTNFGSKEDLFFDSRVWLDSDCEDDYYSVNGEFTPSRGSTPNRYFGPLATAPQKNGKAFHIDDFAGSKSDCSPTAKKKLAELLRDSLSEHLGSENKADELGKTYEGTNGKADTQDAELSQVSSLSEGTPKSKKVKSGLASACCIPGLMSNITSRKQRMSPSH